MAKRKKSGQGKDKNGANATDAADGPMKRKRYERELVKLQGKLCDLQEWVKHSGHRAIIVFEGRDAAGKGGTIKRITESLNPRVCRVVALWTPTERELSLIHI